MRSLIAHGWGSQDPRASPQLCANLNLMHRFAPVALATILAATVPARPQAPSQAPARFTDPANLAGERVRPRDGRELPIDGGHGNNALGLAQQLRRLNTRASLMIIVAHPDDEDGGMLAYYSRGLGARVAILTLNRGEGGQNQMTGDFEDALGLLRTQELLSADRYMGVDQMFGTEVDFGFTKTKQEAFQKWGHDRVLYDAVRAVRIYRPLIIASTFEGAVTDGHGQHQVSGQIAQEVFKAAGDPNVFPELTKEGILPWQPLKVYARVPFSRVSAQGLYDYATGQTVPAQFTNYVTGQTFSTEPTADVTINEGQTDPLLTYAAANAADLRTKPSNLNEQLSYVQFARIGLGLQRSQIGGGERVSRPGRVEVSYHRYGSKLANQPAREDSFYDGIDVSLAGIASLAPDAQKAVPLVLKTNLAGIAQKIETAQKEVSTGKLDYAANDLAAALKLADMTIENLSKLNPDVLPASEKENVLHELRIKRVQLNDALALSLGLSLDATAPSDDLLVDSEAPVHIKLAASSETHLGSPALSLHNASGNETLDRRSAAAAGTRATSAHYPIEQTIQATGTLLTPVTRPYFFRLNSEEPVYRLRDPELRNAPQTPSALTAYAFVPYDGLAVTLARVVHSGPQSVQIIPPVSLTLDRNAQVIPEGTHSLSVDVHTVTEDHPQGELLLQAPLEWVIAAPSRPLRPGTETFSATVPAHPLTATATLKAAAAIAANTYTEGFRPVGYGDLPRTNYYTPATLRVVPVDLKLPPENKRRIAYLPGTGDDVPAALASIGLTPTMLKVSDLTPDKLSQFDTVILGVRTYNAHPDLHGAPTQALLDFARNGGNVVVQYQTPEFTAADAPYPLTGHNERVIDETAPVKILDPSSPLLTTPNKITSADFNNWIEERGHGFLDTWDSHYTVLTETRDPGAPAEHIQPQDPQRGGLITTQLGKGRWTYCAFALYRQLPEAVPGAFRLFVNLLNP
jgi:LmbE family N-acetylglucosaminyl deacetylase